MLPFFKKYGVSPYAAGGSMMNQSSQQTSGLNRDSSNDTDQAKKERSTYQFFGCLERSEGRTSELPDQRYKTPKYQES